MGCGTGRDTALLLDRLPLGHVVAVDGSVRMLEQLRARVADRADRVTVVQADLSRPFPPSVRGDAVMSVATFHWIEDHGALFRRSAAALAPGGRLEAEYGGPGNIAGFLAAVAAADAPWEFAREAATAAALRAAGFTDVDVRVVADPAVLERGPQLEAYVATVLLPATLRDLPAEEGRALVRRTAAELPEPVIDYVRLQVSARLP